MALYEFWVDPLNGLDTNTGTEAAPFQTLRHSVNNGTAALPTTLTASDSVVVNVVPSQPLLNDDHFRIEPGWSGARLLVRSAIPGKKFVANDGCQVFCFWIGNSSADVKVEDAFVECNQVVSNAGAATGGQHLNIEFPASCEFVHARTNAESAFLKDPDPTFSAKLGASFFGWSSFSTSTFTVLELDGFKFQSGDAALAANCGFNAHGGERVSFRNSYIAVNSPGNTSVTIRGPEIYIDDQTEFVFRSDNTGGAFAIDAQNAGTGTTKAEVYGTFDLDFPGYFRIGGEINPSINRAANDATRDPFESFVFKGRVRQRNPAGGQLRAYVGADGAIFEESVFIKDGSTDVHEIYLWATDVIFRNNFCNQILAFGDGQIIQNNIAVGHQTGILLGGTGGGTQAIAGGNNYVISNNFFVGIGSDGRGLDDDAVRDAYPGNLGPLSATIDGNVYLALNGNHATVNSVIFTTGQEDELRDEWQTFGTGNGDNSQFDFLADAQLTRQVSVLLEMTSGIFTESTFETLTRLRDEFIARCPILKEVRKIPRGDTEKDGGDAWRVNGSNFAYPTPADTSIREFDQTVE